MEGSGIKDISLENINSFCRTCLNQLNDIKYNIFDTEVSKWLLVVTALETQLDDDYPNCICNACLTKVNEFCDFRNMCLNSINTFDELIKADTLSTREIIADGQFEKIEKYEMHSDDDEIVKEDAWDNVSCIEDTKINVQILASNTKNPAETDSDSDDDEDNDYEDEKQNDSQSVYSEEDEKPLLTTKKLNKPLRRKKAATVEKKPRMETFHCTKCPKKCFKKERLEAHMRTHEGLRPFPCSQCDKAYNKMSHLTAHISDIHDENKEIITCNVDGCGKTFQRNQTYRVHLRVKHSDVPIETKLFVCEDCGKTFKNSTSLKEHQYRHTGEYPYKCDKCPKKYISQRTYKEHMMRHAGIKNFVCPYCGMRKTTKSELRTHINYHTKEKQWPCLSCPAVFNSSANLGLHTRVVHKGIRKYACKYCDLSFGKSDTLKHHEMRHTGDKPHECKDCGKRFIQVVALRAHMKTHTK